MNGKLERDLLDRHFGFSCAVYVRLWLENNMMVIGDVSTVKGLQVLFTVAYLRWARPHSSQA